LIEHGLGEEFFATDVSLARRKRLLDDRLKEVLADAPSRSLTATQVVEERQMLQQLQADVPRGLSPVFASLNAALDLARQKVMEPDSYSQESLRRDLATLQQASTGAERDGSGLEESLFRLQRVHPGAERS